MKKTIFIVLISLVLLGFAGTARAADMSGEVIAVDGSKGVFTLKSGAVATDFTGEAPAMIKDMKVGDKVTVQYMEAGGKKIVTKIAPFKKQVSLGC